MEIWYRLFPFFLVGIWIYNMLNLKRLYKIANTQHFNITYEILLKKINIYKDYSMMKKDLAKNIKIYTERQNKYLIFQTWSEKRNKKEGFFWFNYYSILKEKNDSHR